MRKIILCLIMVLMGYGISPAQSYTYGNEWINYGQKYFRIKLFKEGIYKLDSATLSNAGVPLNAIDARNLQVFIRGEEQYIHVSGESDGQFDGSDYLEFYGYPNDCAFDSSLYIFEGASLLSGQAFLPNPYVSVLQDTLVAFLTWNTSTSNKRFFLETDNSFASFTASPFFYHFALKAETGGYSNGAANSIGAWDSRYTATEARIGTQSCSQGSSYSVLLNTPNAYSGGPNASLVTTHLGLSRDFGLAAVPGHDHHLLIEWKNGSGTFNTIADTFFYGYQPIRNTISINPSQLGSVTEIKVSSLPDPSYAGANYTYPAYSSIFYPHTFDLGNQASHTLFIPDATAQSKFLADFSNFSYSGGATVKAFDLDNGKLVYPVMTGSAGKFLLPNSGSANPNKIYLTSTDNDIIVSSLTPVNGTGSFENYLLAPKDSAFILVTHSKFLNEAIQYRNYKQTLAAGGHQVVLANIQDLYDQFAYGIVKHPKAIRNFSKLLLDSFPTDPKYLFLVGKSTYGYYGPFSQAYYNMNLVPSYGYPPADNLITAGLNGTYLEPAIPTGRLAATTGTEILDYLEKVKQHDTASVASWQKQILHFVGGTIQSEQNMFNSIMSLYRMIAMDTLFGGNVTTFIKNTSAPIQTIIADSVIDRVNAGAALMTFYGHSSNQSFDFNLNDPGVYDNYGRYPVLLSNSCYTGDIHTNDTVSISEKYIFAKEKGSIAFLGSVHLGVAQFLQYISEHFYRHMSFYSYGEGVGDILKGAITNTQYSVTTADSIERITCMEMTLHGDPSVRMNLFTKPDYSITNADLFFNSDIYVDSIQVNLRISNLSRATRDSITVKITRTFPDGSTRDYLNRIKGPFYCDTLSFFIPVDFVKGPGLNFFSAIVDFYDEVDELDNILNNRTSGNIPYMVRGNDIVPVYPYEFEVVPLASSIRLKASTSDPFAPAAAYIFQLDTSDAFSSPLLQSTLINSTGGVLEWNVNLPLGDSTVYFWRVSRDSIDALGYNWRESSFQTIANRYGWGQAHFHQYKNDIYRFVNYDKPNRLFRFFDSKNHIHIKNGIYTFWGGDLLPVDHIFNYNSSPVHVAGAVYNGWSFSVIDSISGEFEMNTRRDTSTAYYQFGTNHQFGGTEPVPYYDFGPTQNPFLTPFPVILDSMKKFLGSVGTGKYLVGYSNNFWRYPPATQPPYPQAVMDSLAVFGLDTSAMQNSPDSTVICFLGRRGMPAGSAHMEISTDPMTNLIFQDSIVAHWDRGYITSPLIGPAAAWNSIHWRYTSLETGSADTVVIKVIGVTPGGQEVELLSLGEDSLDVPNVGSVIDANVYPYLKLVAELDDDGLNTAPQLRRWQVLYDPAPEGAIDPSSGFSVLNDTLQEGDYLKVRIPFKNISEFAFSDSLVFAYWIEDANNVSQPAWDTLKRNNLQPDSVILDTVTVSTLGYPGANALWVDVNQLGNPKNQKEQYHFNNLIRIPFRVNPDIINPILDVTFDGIHILNSDIVSAKPEILITLKDENLFLALNDTADFEVKLIYPGSSTEIPVWFGTSLTFTPASLPNNSCKIEFRPEFSTDGLYTLHVHAKDRSDNLSGATDYRIQFEVINKPSVTHVMNYPNPFSTKTKFVFTLTGSEVPETFMIQIMTITGRVVREIKQEELGFIHIGRNITEYAWDGKDDFGDQLGNGVYLYRVVTRLNGEEIERRESGADPFFTKEIGKMVLIR